MKTTIAILALLLAGCFEPEPEPTEPDATPMAADASPDAESHPDATPDADPGPVTGTEIALRLYGAMCEHERQCNRNPSDDCAYEMAARFCETRLCGETETLDRAVLIACADEAITWQCPDQTNHHPPCVLELLGLVGKAIPQ